jgi:hypothetical protein
MQQSDQDRIPGDERTFAVDGRRVVHETIDGEAILIALDTGTYYSLTGSGAEMWALLSAGHPVGAAATALAACYPEHAEQAHAALRRLAQELEQEGLLVAVEDAAGAPLVPPSAQGAFAPPALHRYTDMEYFLRLDPIHEIDPAKGWPVAADGATFG